MSRTVVIVCASIAGCVLVWGVLLVGVVVAVQVRRQHPTESSVPVPTTVPQVTQPPASQPQVVQPPAPIPEYKFGEEVRQGDLLISMVEVQTECPFAGQRHGQFQPINLSLAHIKIKNTSAGKIGEWGGWQGTGEIEDEFGNKFKPLDVRGWSWLPRNEPNLGWDGDVATRIQPGATYENAVYFQAIPPTSKQGIVTLSLNGSTLKFRGRLGVRR